MPVWIAASSFGSEMAAKEQTDLVNIVKASGASGIEIRREMLADSGMRGLSGDREQLEPETLPKLRKLRDKIRICNLSAGYSAPIAMWLPGGRLNDRELNAVLQEGKELEACYVKVSLGWYDAGRSELNELKRLLSESIGDARSTGQPIRLMVENDQTMHGGNAEILKRFLERCAVEAVPVRMIFDIGNWHWVGESPMRAANMLAEYVDCIHCKQAQAGEDGWTAVPLSEAPEAEWREVLSCFPRELPRVIEFPITEPPLESTAGKYVRLLSEA